jgi:hypothetical protein
VYDRRDFLKPQIPRVIDEARRRTSWGAGGIYGPINSSWALKTIDVRVNIKVVIGSRIMR